MAQTHDIGSFFWQRLSIKKGTPLIHRASSVEIDEPFRISAPIVFHVWPGTGIAVGRWMDSDFEDEEDALFGATHIGGIGNLPKGWEIQTDSSGKRIIPRGGH